MSAVGELAGLGVEERIGEIDVMVHRVTTGDGVEVAVTRLSSAPGAELGEPVILVHGTYCQRSFWISDKGRGLGPYLRERGFDVWIPEMRGHGRSPRGPGFRYYTAEDHLRWDLPAVARLVSAETGGKAHFVGHSWGGSTVIGAQAGGWLDPGAVASMVVLGANMSEGDQWLARPVPAALARLLLKLLGRVPASLFGLGPEPESEGYVLDFYRWKGRGGSWETREGASYWAGAGRLTAPLLAFAAADDQNDPPSGCRTLFDAVGSAEKRFVLLGEAEGFEKDYRHLDMVIGAPAAREVYPRIRRWIADHPAQGTHT